jgi:restriction system protein
MPKRRRRKAFPGTSAFLLKWTVILVAVYVGVSLLFQSVRQNPLLALILLAAAVSVVFLWLRRRIQRRLRVRTLGELLSLTPAQFEEAVGDLLSELGYRDVRRVGGAGDLAADIQCRDPEGMSVIVQCKRYAPGTRIGSPVIQTFIGMQSIHHRADRGIFVTTSEFTQPAVTLARHHGLTLIDGAELSRLILAVHQPTQDA